MKKVLLALLGIMLTATFAPGVARAEIGGWSIAVTPYLWGAGINGSATLGLHQADAEKTFSEILDDLEFAGMLNLQARKGRFGAYTDVTFLGMSGMHEKTLADGTPVLQASSSIDSWIVDFGASWSVAQWGAGGKDTRGAVDLLVGGRYWSVDTEIKAESPVFGGERRVEKTMSWVDPIVGARFAAALTPKLQLLGRADVGGFELGSASKLTWSASAFLGWHFTPLLSAYVGYKHLAIEREDDHANTLDLAFSGPALGLAFTF